MQRDLDNLDISLMKSDGETFFDEIGVWVVIIENEDMHNSEG